MRSEAATPKPKGRATLAVQDAYEDEENAAFGDGVVDEHAKANLAQGKVQKEKKQDMFDTNPLFQPKAPVDMTPFLERELVQKALHNVKLSVEDVDVDLDLGHYDTFAHTLDSLAEANSMKFRYDYAEANRKQEEEQEALQFTSTYAYSDGDEFEELEKVHVGKDEDLHRK